MEPPPKQSYTSNYNVSSSWPEEERYRCLARKSGHGPFISKACLAHTPFPCKIPSFSSSYLKQNESMPDVIKLEPKRTYFRIKENGCGVDGGSRSVGLSSTPFIPKPKQPTLTQPPSSLDCPEFSSVSCQGSMSDAISSSQPPFYSFLPMGPNSCEKTLNEQRRETLDGVDLSLKL
ncbi:uncharacterized protein [Elaeis guineensis]|uniref:uncharacterized protein n=1 Tax=Elaeis guineensis var. tenera TaxID=51953 RepID=UPI003C6D1C82